ncbi:hypothetical protein B0H10DRAFT_2202350, partial [Mycena sp. CBHHK59/15]
MSYDASLSLVPPPSLPTSSSLDPVASRLPPPSGMIHSPNAPPHQPSLSLPSPVKHWCCVVGADTGCTRDASGTPATSASSGHKRKASVENSKDKKKKKAGKKAGLVRSKAADPKQAASSGRSSVGGVTEEDESMVKFGGPAIDDDVDEQIERAQPAQGKKRGLPQNASPCLCPDCTGSAYIHILALIQPIIKIAPAAPRPLTKKEQRNNAKKWSLPHLPRNTASQFTEEVIPLARELLGTLPPWAVLTVKQVQEIVDKVYGAGKHIVLFDGPWFGLVAYRASDWRSGFGIQALKGIQALINMYQGADNSESDEEAAGPLSDDPLDAAPKPAKFTFDTPEGIAAFVAWALQKHAETALWPFIGRRGVMVWIRRDCFSRTSSCTPSPIICRLSRRYLTSTSIWRLSQAEPFSCRYRLSSAPFNFGRLHSFKGRSPAQH